MRHNQTRRVFLGRAVGTVGLLGLASRSALAVVDEKPNPAELTAKAVAFLKPRQADDGSWSGTRKEPGITALVITALLRSKLVTPAEPSVTKGLAYLERFVGPKGGVNEASHANYSTSIALMAFKEANVGGRYDSILNGGQDFLKDKQWDETEGKKPEDVNYGGAGYGGTNSRPDLSNTAFMIEALRESGLSANDPALQKALVFVSRCQNLKSEFNDQPWSGKINDGGFIYTSAGGGTSLAGKADAGGLRSYASMTYAGLKSMIYAGLGQKGLYYYYQTFAKTLELLGKPAFVDASGTSHDWRAELAAALAKRQDANGSWVNPADGFMEGDPNLVTAYGLLALAYSRPRA